jgi:pSer/pThr/pTyr-binding forkhead associated (FHA) protein
VSSSSSYSGRFQIRVEADGRSRLVRLRLGVATVGRSTNSTIHIQDRNISRRHLRLIRKKKRVYAEDMQSANGTLVNGEPLVGRQRIFRDDVIRVGDVQLELVGDKLKYRDEETTERTVRPAEQTEIVEPPVVRRPRARKRERTLIIRRRKRPRRAVPWVAVAVLVAAALLSATAVVVYVIRQRESRQNVRVLQLEEIPITPQP